MDITFDENKRLRTLEERGLDFHDAVRLFAGGTVTKVDDRRDYGEQRFVTYGHIDDDAVVVVWTEREGTRRVLSMRRAHLKEMNRVRVGRS